MPPLICHLLRLRRQGRVLRQGKILRQGRAPRQGRSLRQGGAPWQGRILQQGTVPATPRQRRPQLLSLEQVPLASKLPLGSSSFDLLFGYLLDFSSFFGRQIHLLRSRWRPRLLLMMPPPPKKRPALTIPPAKRPPRLPPQQPTRGLAIALTALRPQERQALRQPPTLPPMPQCRAPKGPSRAST